MLHGVLYFSFAVVETDGKQLCKEADAKLLANRGSATLERQGIHRAFL